MQVGFLLVCNDCDTGFVFVGFL